MATTKKLMGTTAVGGDFLAIEDVFSTYVYTGNAEARSITNGIDLAGEGGLVWSKSRSSGVGVGDNYHYLFDTERGSDKYIFSNATNAEVTSSLLLTSFNSDGYSIGTRNANNKSGETYASWTWRKAPRFFDVVTYTGDGVAGREVAHNLGCEVGFMVVKCTSTTGDWYAYHRTLTGAPETDAILLNDTGVAIDNIAYWNDTAPTSTHFTLGTNTNINGAGKTFVAYLWAHDPLGPSGDGSDGLIACGFAGTNGTLTDLGWEPQWLLLRNTSSSGSNWIVVDNMRGVPTGGLDKQLNPNLNAAETDYSVDLVEFDPRGFIARNAQNFRYIAIRRGPMRAPTSGTEVFAPTKQTTTGYTQITGLGFAPDMVFQKAISSTDQWNVVDKLRGPSNSLELNRTSSESTDTQYFLGGWLNDGVVMGSASSGQFNGYNPNSLSFLRRAPGFFDAVAWTGAPTTVNHNLGVVPELIIQKYRSANSNWFVWRPNIDYGYLNDTSAFTSTAYGTVTDTSFTPLAANPSTTDIAYLFATLPGVSKVGIYTGNGTSQTIDCGFTSGARFVLIKRTDSTGDWYVWDTARGIVAGNDPHLSLNSTAAEVTTDDSIDPDSSGFIVNQVSATNVNVSSASYIFLAIS